MTLDQLLGGITKVAQAGGDIYRIANGGTVGVVPPAYAQPGLSPATGKVEEPAPKAGVQPPAPALPSWALPVGLTAAGVLLVVLIVKASK